MDFVSQRYIVHSFMIGRVGQSSDTLFSCMVTPDPDDGSPPMSYDLIGGVSKDVDIYLNGAHESINGALKGQLPILLLFALWAWPPPLKLEAKLDFSAGPGVLKEAWFTAVKPGSENAIPKDRKNNWQQEYPE